MANKEEIKNVVSETKKEEKHVGSVETQSAFDFGFGKVDGFAWQSEGDNFETAGNETVFSGTGVMLQRSFRDGGEGVKYTNLCVSYNLPVNGGALQQDIKIVPIDNIPPMFDLINKVFGEEEYYPVDIVKWHSPKTQTRPERTTWSLRISTKGDIGNDVIVLLKPSGTKDDMLFTNLINMLLSVGLVK